jgi:hypothetical protein
MTRNARVVAAASGLLGFPPVSVAATLSPALVRALVHRAMHLAAETKSAEFCALATFLGEMIGHAHQLLHGGDKSAAAHRDVVH